jgi:hypothetical protein
MTTYAGHGKNLGKKLMRNWRRSQVNRGRTTLRVQQRLKFEDYRSLQGNSAVEGEESRNLVEATNQ